MNLTATNDPSNFLRRSLRANAIFSSLSGLVFLFAGQNIAAFLGEVPPLLVTAIGAQLLLFAGALVWLASRPAISIPLALGVITADLLWVVGTIVVVNAEILSRGGTILVVVLADVVLLLAALQSFGVYRSNRSIQATPS